MRVASFLSHFEMAQADGSFSSARSSHVSPAQAAAMPGLVTGVAIKEGWLVKHPVRGEGWKRRRWITLLEDRIEWRGAINDQPKGSFEISSRTRVRLNQGANGSTTRLRIFLAETELLHHGVVAVEAELTIEEDGDSGGQVLPAWESAIRSLLEAKQGPG